MKRCTYSSNIFLSIHDLLLTVRWHVPSQTLHYVHAFISALFDFPSNSRLNDEKFVFLTNTTIEEMHSEWNILKRKLKREIALSKKYTKLLIYAWSNILKYRIIIRYVTVTRAVPRARFSISCLDCLSLDMKLYLNPRSFTSHLNWWFYSTNFVDSIFHRSYFSVYVYL